jgi:hypothetical protein
MLDKRPRAERLGFIGVIPCDVVRAKIGKWDTSDVSDDVLSPLAVTLKCPGANPRRDVVIEPID